MHNPLTEEQASSINPDIESLLISEIDKYEKKKNRQRINPLPIQNPEIPIQSNIQIINSEDEINARVKEATDILRQDFTKATYEKMLTLK